MSKVMLKRIIKFGIIVILVVIMAFVLIYSVGIEIGGRSRIYIDDYNEFYLYKTNISRDFMGFPGMQTQRYKIWLLPGQKNKLLNKIKEDVNIELSRIAEDNKDIIKGYEISDDFKKVYIYFCDNLQSADNSYSMYRTLTEKIEYRVELYFQIENGYGNTDFDGGIINYVQQFVD